MAGKILIATDGSDHARRAVELGADLAAARGLGVVLVHVLLRGDVSELRRHMAEVEYAPAEGGRPLSGALGELPHARFPLADLLPEDAKDPEQPLRAIAESILDEAARAAEGRGARVVDRVIEDGDPARRILERAEATGAEMIVTGARGVSDLRAFMLGSVSHRVANLSPVTCVTVR